MKTINLISILLLVATLISSAQESKLSIISNAGSQFSNKYYNVEYTFGELVISSVDNDNYLVFQGFQQPLLFSSNSIITTENQVNLLVYPNPVVDILYINFPIEIQEVIELNLFDLTGKKVISFTALPFISNKSTIDLDVSMLQQGNYFLKLSSKSKSFETYKIIKIS